MNANGESSQAEVAPGSVGNGIMQALGIYVLAVIVLFAVESNTIADWGTVGTPTITSAVVLCVLLAVWHVRRKRGNSAFGVLVGMIVWPFVGGIGLGVLMSYMLSHARIPF